jgi:hypothetical protein
MRLTKFPQKLAYVIVARIVTYLVDSSARFVPAVWAGPLLLLETALIVAFVVVGVRSFRGEVELVAPPRPWWRWTGRPKAGFWLATLFTANAVLLVANATRGGFGLSGYGVFFCVALLVIAGFYLNSSIQLLRRPLLIPPRDTSTIPQTKSGFRLY